jgi:hypothetical protein
MVAISRGHIRSIVLNGITTLERALVNGVKEGTSTPHDEVESIEIRGRSAGALIENVPS